MKKVAIIALCIVMFASVQPACAVIGVDPACETLKFIGRVLDAVFSDSTEEERAKALESEIIYEITKIVLTPTTTVPMR
ncbi:MAG: hypothetical protein IJ576_03805 [Synergistaceae bacterium]|nr:hypothetical protein [Synergistaceae bacterium]